MMFGLYHWFIYIKKRQALPNSSDSRSGALSVVLVWLITEVFVIYSPELN